MSLWIRRTEQWKLWLMESVSPHSEEDDEPELEHVLTEEAVRCVKTLKIYIGKMENGQKTFSK
jgi:hypothetical protein